MSRWASVIERCVVMIVVLWAALTSAAAAEAASINGVVQKGGTGTSTPVRNAQVTLCEATLNQPAMLGQATTNDAGQFTINSPIGESSSIFFATAKLGRGGEYAVVLGQFLPASTTINELTTVAAAYSMAQFYQSGTIAGKTFGLRIAAGMNDNIVSTTTGQSSTVMTTSPNADETNSRRIRCVLRGRWRTCWPPAPTARSCGRACLR